MAQPSLDEGVEKLQEFCSLMAQTNNQLQQATSVLEEHGNSVDELEEQAEEKFDALSDALRDIVKELDEGGEDATEEIGRLTDSATEISGNRLGAAEDDVEETAGDLEGRIHGEQGDLEKAYSELTDDGFDALGTTVDEVKGDVREAAEQTDEAFNDLETGLQSLEQQTEQARNETVQEVDEAAETLRTQEADGLATEAGEAASAWTGELAPNLQGECTGIGDPLQQLYDDWQSEGEADGTELINEGTKALGEAGDYLAGELGKELEQAVDEAESRSLAGLLETVEIMIGLLEAGVQSVEPLTTIVEEGEIVQRVIAEIDRVLNAME